jgi:hypothetical protein
MGIHCTVKKITVATLTWESTSLNHVLVPLKA